MLILHQFLDLINEILGQQVRHLQKKLFPMSSCLLRVDRKHGYISTEYSLSETEKDTK